METAKQPLITNDELYVLNIIIDLQNKTNNYVPYNNIINRTANLKKSTYFNLMQLVAKGVLVSRLSNKRRNPFPYVEYALGPVSDLLKEQGIIDE